MHLRIQSPRLVRGNLKGGDQFDALKVESTIQNLFARTTDPSDSVSYRSMNTIEATCNLVI